MLSVIGSALLVIGLVVFTFGVVYSPWAITARDVISPWPFALAVAVGIGLVSLGAVLALFIGRRRPWRVYARGGIVVVLGLTLWACAILAFMAWAAATFYEG